MKWLLIVTLCAVVATSIALLLVGTEKRSGYGAVKNPEDQFLDEPQSNSSPNSNPLDLAFVDLLGNSVLVKDYRNKQNVVLVFTRGFSGVVCPYCSAQTSRLIAQYDEFVKRNAAVLVVFPGPKKQIQEFIGSSERQAAEKTGKGAASFPFPVLLDVDFVAVDQLGLRDDLAKPSTYILDKQGELRFAYVGSNSADRPSIKAMLSQLDTIEAESANIP